MNQFFYYSGVTLWCIIGLAATAFVLGYSTFLFITFWEWNRKRVTKLYQLKEAFSLWRTSRKKWDHGTKVRDRSWERAIHLRIISEMKKEPRRMQFVRNLYAAAIRNVRK